MARIVRTVKGRPEPFYRCGTRFTREGEVFEDSAFTDAEWKRIMDDPLLEIEAAGAPAAKATPELIERIAAKIPELPEDAFGKSGAPNLGPLRKAMPDDAEAIDDAARDAGHALFLERKAEKEAGGGTAPAA